MGGQSTSSSSSSGSSQREDERMDKFEHLTLRHRPPPRATHSRGKNHHHHHRHHCCKCPPPSFGCRGQQFLEHSPMEDPHHLNLPPLMRCPDHHLHHKEGNLRVKTPKHLKKVHRLHRKITKAYKVPRNARHGAHHISHMHFPPTEEGFFRTPFGHYPGPEMSLHHYHPRCHGWRPHSRPQRRSFNRSDVAAADIASVNPREMEVLADPPSEVGPTSDMPPSADVLALVI